MRILRNCCLVLALAGLVGSASMATMSPKNDSHRSSLPASVTLRDGSVRNVTLEGVGCERDMCSRVQIREQDRAIWLDDISAVSDISRTPGVVWATVQLKNGALRHANIVSVNRVLYIENGSATVQRLDLGQVSRIDFANGSSR